MVPAIEELMTIELKFAFRALQFLTGDPHLFEKGTPQSQMLYLQELQEVRELKFTCWRVVQGRATSEVN